MINGLSELIAELHRGKTNLRPHNESEDQCTAELEYKCKVYASWIEFQRTRQPSDNNVQLLMQVFIMKSQDFCEMVRWLDGYQARAGNSGHSLRICPVFSIHYSKTQEGCSPASQNAGADMHTLGYSRSSVVASPQVGNKEFRVIRTAAVQNTLSGRSPQVTRRDAGNGPRKWDFY